MGASTPQPERVAPQDETALYAQCNGDLRSVAVEFVRSVDEAAVHNAPGQVRRGFLGDWLVDDGIPGGAVPEELVLTTGSAANGGSCVARHDGRVVFVRYALPGEVVRVRVRSVRGSYWHADTLEVLEPSPDRVDSLCSIAASTGRAAAILRSPTPTRRGSSRAGRCQSACPARRASVEGAAELLGDGDPRAGGFACDWMWVPKANPDSIGITAPTS